jgi:hypothetical protein
MKNLSTLLLFVLTSQWSWCQSSQITVAYQFANLRGAASGFEIGMRKQIKPRSWVGARIAQITDRNLNYILDGNRVRPYYLVQIGRTYQFFRVGKAFSANIETGLSSLLDLSGNLYLNEFYNCGFGCCYAPISQKHIKIRPGVYSNLALQYILTKGLTLQTQTSLSMYPGRKKDIGWLNTTAWQIGLGYEWN